LRMNYGRARKKHGARCGKDPDRFLIHVLSLAWLARPSWGLNNCGGSRNRTYISGFGDRRPAVERYPLRIYLFYYAEVLFARNPRFLMERL
jgi:hypothetical protein